MSDIFWMKQAFELALHAQSKDEVPVGAVLVDAQGILLGSGWNQTRTRNDPTAHAEILALREAAANLENYRLLNATLYVTLEPCPMCAGALVEARIKRLVFATRDFERGAAGSICNLLKGYPLNHRVQIDEGAMEGECRLLLQNFFKGLRSF